MTGSSGHLGEALVRTLRGRGDDVVGIDVTPSPSTTVVGSITDAGTVREAVAGAEAVLHPATRHKPHVATHGRQDFVDVNVTGTLTLLEAAVDAGVGAFVLTSTTSTFGRAMTPPAGAPAAWITEDTVPQPRNIYGATKLAAEHVAEVVHQRDGLPVLVLRTSRFFPEPDDRADVRAAFEDENVKANELLHRRVDIADVVSAHLRALERAASIGFGRYVVSATTPFAAADLRELGVDPARVVARHYPDQPELYAAGGWRLPEAIDRVYSNERARRDLGWNPEYGFEQVLESLRSGSDWRSALTHAVGVKGYHRDAFPDGLYPVE
nr:NAD(P)-dependent oxidoreductase [Egibacter rhizosphaerae]